MFLLLLDGILIIPKQGFFASERSIILRATKGRKTPFQPDKYGNQAAHLPLSTRKQSGYPAVIPLLKKKPDFWQNFKNTCKHRPTIDINNII